ncbi:PEGA domain-containing protein [Archangium violaceum]|uniref:PEGA domain-containing protein n=1 Tax=Archangium violaceum TaxID=83451 RepID=UPI002B2928BE|nr:PEGA domain-containing protein [Archangium gephyra]
MMHLSRWLALVLVVALGAGGASAAPRRAPNKANLEEAQSRYQRGKELYAENDFQASLLEFQRAYELAPSYRLLYNIAQVQYQLQDYAGALRSFQQYLLEGSTELSSQRKDEVQREIDKLQGRVAYLRITVSKPGAEITVDDVSVGISPLPETVLVSAGRRRVVASLPGHLPASRTVDVAGRDTANVALELVSTSAPQQPAAPVAEAPVAKPAAPGSSSEVASTGQRGFPLVPWIATGGLAVASGVTGVLALSASNDLRKQREAFGATRTQLDEASQKTRTLALTSDVLLAATAVAAGVSTFLTLTSQSADSASSPRVQVGVGPGSVGVAGAF